MKKIFTALVCSFLSLTSCSFQIKQVSSTKEELSKLYPSSTVVILHHNDWTKGHYKEKIAEFKANPLEFGDIVFIGNSITEQGGNWAQRFDNAKVKNRGIAGDVTAGVLKRLKEIYYYKPEKVFIKIGINDLFHSDLTPESVANNIKLMVAMISQESPNTKICVQTLLPTRDNNPSKERIDATNKLIKEISATEFIKVIDLHSAFADQNDLMIKEYTHDGLHLTEAGYLVWQNFIKDIVNEGKTTSYLKETANQNSVGITEKSSVVFTSVIPENIEAGTILKVSFKYTCAKEVNIFSGISLLNDWTWVSLVGGEGQKFPAGKDVEGSFDIAIPKGTKPSNNFKDKMNYKINIEMKSLPENTWIAGDYPASPLNIIRK